MRFISWEEKLLNIFYHAIIIAEFVKKILFYSELIILEVCAHKSNLLQRLVRYLWLNIESIIMKLCYFKNHRHFMKHF